MHSDLYNILIKMFNLNLFMRLQSNKPTLGTIFTNKNNVDIWKKDEKNQGKGTVLKGCGN